MIDAGPSVNEHLELQTRKQDELMSFIYVEGELIIAMEEVRDKLNCVFQAVFKTRTTLPVPRANAHWWVSHLQTPVLSFQILTESVLNCHSKKSDL